MIKIPFDMVGLKFEPRTSIFRDVSSDTFDLVGKIRASDTGGVIYSLQAGVIQITV